MIFSEPLPQVGILSVYLCIVKFKKCITNTVYYDNYD